MWDQSRDINAARSSYEYYFSEQIKYIPIIAKRSLRLRVRPDDQEKEFELSLTSSSRGMHESSSGRIRSVIGFTIPTDCTSIKERAATAEEVELEW